MTRMSADHHQIRGRSRLVLMLLVVAALAALVVVLAREGPDKRLTGPVTERQPHRLCVAGSNGRDVCVRVDSPERVADVALGDCVAIRYSAEEVLIALDSLVDGCDPSP